MQSNASRCKMEQFDMRTGRDGRNCLSMIPLPYLIPILISRFEYASCRILDYCMFAIDICFDMVGTDANSETQKYFHPTQFIDKNYKPLQLSTILILVGWNACENREVSCTGACSCRKGSDHWPFNVWF